MDGLPGFLLAALALAGSPGPATLSLAAAGAAFGTRRVAGYFLGILIGMVGVILLIGIVKKNGIMMVDFAINAERTEGKTSHEAIRQACLLRFRPILMTTMAALLSGLPLMIQDGAGSELRKPLGFAMVGGLAVSQILTLYTTPVVYLYLARLQRMFTRKPERLPRLAEKMAAD